MSVKPDLFEETLALALDNATGPISVVAFGNGVELAMPAKYAELDHVITSKPENLGVPAGLHELWLQAKHRWPDNPQNEVVAYVHDDVYIYERGWDERVRAVFERDPKCGLAGFGGSTAYGSPSIYKARYSWQQVARQNFFSNMRSAETHGQRIKNEMPIVFTDGYSMIVRRSLLDTIGGWSVIPRQYVHYGYDCFIACMARRHGYNAWLVPVDIEHGVGGWGALTRNEDGGSYQQLANQNGGDKAVHDGVHEFLYNHFRDVMPLRLR